MDYEVELAIVIGRSARYVAKEDALDYVAGYTLMNDYTERALFSAIGAGSGRRARVRTRSRRSARSCFRARRSRRTK